MSNKSVHFKNLDLIRFIAAMMVFIQHGISGTFKHLEIKRSVLERILFVITNGGTGVSIFFGKPDFSLKEYKLTVFVDSEYFHGKDWDTEEFRIKTNREFWRNKIEFNKY